MWLGPSARTVLQSLPRLRGATFVFGFGSTSRTQWLDDFWRGIRAVARLPGVRIHDLRHSFASFYCSIPRGFQAPQSGLRSDAYA